MSKAIREAFDKILSTGPALVADELLDGGAPRRRLFWGNFKPPAPPARPKRPLKMEAFLERARSHAVAVTPSQVVGTVRVMTARAKGKLDSEYEAIRVGHRSPNFVRIEGTDALRPLNARERCLLLNLPGDYFEQINGCDTDVTYLIGSTFGAASIAWALGPSLAFFPRL